MVSYSHIEITLLPFVLLTAPQEGRSEEGQEMRRRRIVRDRWRGRGTRGGRTGRRHGEHDLGAAISLHQGELLVSMWTTGIGASYLHQHGTSTFSQVPQLTLIWTSSRSKWDGVPVPTTYLRAWNDHLMF